MPPAPETPRPKKPRFANPTLQRTNYFDYLSFTSPSPPTLGEIVDFPVADLWLDEQPRLIVPEEVLADLIAGGRAQPPALLAELRRVAGERPYYARVLAGIEDLARSVTADGILNPLLVVQIDDRHVVRDGHRRSLAALVANVSRVPIRIVDEASPVQAAARQLVVNLQRSDLTALEQGRWLLRLARLVEQELRAERGLAAGPLVVDALVEREADDETDEIRTMPRAERGVAAEVRSRACQLTGLSSVHYYRLLRLNRLSPAAQAVGLELTEKQLRPITTLSPEDQPAIVAFVVQRSLTSRETETLVRVARSGDRDAVKRVMARLAKEDAGRQRTAVSWEPLLHAVPRDFEARCAALHAELAALPDEARRVRLRAMREQQRLARELANQFGEILALYGDEELDDAPPTAT